MVKIQTYDSKKEDSYIVLLHDNVDKEVHLNWLRHLPNTLVVITHEYDSRSLNGFTGEFDAAALSALCNSKDVKSISENYIMKHRAEQQNAPWGISRISRQQPHAVDAIPENLDYTYQYNTPVDVYVVDGGINIDHVEFEGRARWGVTIANGLEVDDQFDTHGHGTHCAGIIGSSRFGVAKNVELIAVKVTQVFDGDPEPGMLAGDIITGFQWVLNQAVTTGKPSVMNVSLGLRAHALPVPGEDNPMELIINDLIVAGVHVVVAAGNDNGDVELDVPGGFANPITVAASNIIDRRWASSNWGAGIDVFAPGVDITSTGIGNPMAAMVMTGTSMACPHVSGLVAYLIGRNGNVLPLAMKENIIAMCIPFQNPLSDLGNGSPDRLAHNPGL